MATRFILYPRENNVVLLLRQNERDSCLLTLRATICSDAAENIGVFTSWG